MHRPYELFCDDPMHTLADKANIGDLHIAKVRFGGDVSLQPRTERFAEQVSEDSKDQGQRNEQEPPTSGFGSLNRRPGKGRRKKRGDGKIRSAARMDGESAFTSFESRHRFCCRIRYIFKLKIPKKEETGRVGMSGHGCFMCARKNMQRGMFQRMITPCFKYEGKI